MNNNKFIDEEQFDLENIENEDSYVLVNLRIDYECRHSDLNDVCLYDFVRKYRKKNRKQSDETYIENKLTEPNNKEKKRRGKAQPRYEFLEQHSQSESHILIERETYVIPVLIGPQIPRRGREVTQQRYCRSILTLFKPWRKFSDLCHIGESWIDAFNRHETYLKGNDCNEIIENIELLHECKEQRDDHITQVIEQLPNDSYIENNSDSDEENKLLECLEIDDCFNLNRESKNFMYTESALNILTQISRFEPCK